MQVSNILWESHTYMEGYCLMGLVGSSVTCDKLQLKMTQIHTHTHIYIYIQKHTPWHTHVQYASHPKAPKRPNLFWTARDDSELRGGGEGGKLRGMQDSTLYTQGERVRERGGRRGRERHYLGRSLVKNCPADVQRRVARLAFPKPNLPNLTFFKTFGLFFKSRLI